MHLYAFPNRCFSFSFLIKFIIENINFPTTDMSASSPITKETLRDSKKQQPTTMHVHVQVMRIRDREGERD